MKRLFLLVLLFPLAAAAAPDLGRDLEILKVQMRIDEMWREDEAFRAGLDSLLKKGYARALIMSHPQFGDQWKKVTQQNIDEMKKIIAKWEWPSISTFGARTDEQAHIIVSHAEHDPKFQQTALAAVTKALEKRDTSPMYFAMLWDRVQVTKNLPQRYGTQGLCRGKGVWEPSLMENPSGVNRRRQLMGLAPIDETRASANRACYMSPNLNE